MTRGTKMNRGPARNTWQPIPGRWIRGVTAAAAAASVALIAGCGHEIAGAQQARAAAAAAATASAVSGNVSCLRAMPVTERALGILQHYQRGAVTGAQAPRELAAAQADLERLARSTSDTVLQENLAEASDAFAAFRVVMTNRNAPAFPPTYADLEGKLTGFRRICSVGNAGFGTGTTGWVAASANTALSRSATGYEGKGSLQVANAGKSPATAGFTDSPAWVPTTLKGSEQIGLWARAVTGTPMLTLQVRELAGSIVIASQQVTMRLGLAFHFVHLTYQVRRPGTSRLSVTVSAADVAPGAGFLVDDITIVR